MASFWGELRRRNVFKVAVAYAIVAWLLIEMAATVFPALKLPEWTVTFVTALILISFPVILIGAWAFEVTPDGIKRTREVPLEHSITHITGRKFDFAIIGLLVIAVVFLVVDNYVLKDATDRRAVTESDEPAEAVAEIDRSIAVLPFANRSASEADIFFVDGLHDDLLTHIARIGSIKTISRTSVMPYRDTDKSLPDIAKELGVATIMEGGVQRAEDRVRINVQLIDAKTDEHLWAETYDRQLTTSNIFAIQSEIAAAIAETLRASLTPVEQDRIKRVPTENMAALEAYFKGRQRLMTRTTAGFVDAIEHFQQAIALDPNFALAYVGLADSYAIQGSYTGLPPDEQVAKAEAALEQAFALDDGLGEAYALLGAVKNHYRQDYAGAEIAFKRALELSPNYASAHHWYGLLLGSLGRSDEAVIQSQQALELEPLSPNIGTSLSLALTATGQYEAALAQAERVIALSPTSPGGFANIAFIHAGVFGELDKGVSWHIQAVEREPGDPNNSAYLGLLYLDLGDVARADYWLKQSIAIGTARTLPNVGMALLHTYRDEDDQALEYANRAVQTIPVFGADPPAQQVALSLVRNAKLKADRAAEARSFYQTHYPALLNDDEPAVNRTNLIAAINLALVLTRTGEQDRSDKLLDRSLAVIQGTHRLRFIVGSGIGDVQILALQGKTDEALAALRQAIDDGWRRYWWYHAEHDPNLDSIRDEPEFQAMMDEIQSDMAEQLARVHDWQANGEMAPIPDSLH